MTEHVSPLDATFLELEEADPSAHMHIGALLTFEPPPGQGPPDIEAMRRHLRERLGALPRYLQRLSEPHTGGLSWPAWEHEPNFNIDAHVHRAALPEPGGERELMEWVGEYWSHRLDRLMPLWDATLLEGLEGGRWALVTKTHHCMVDGVGSIDVGNLLLDTAPEPSGCLPETPPAPETHDPGPLLGRLPSVLAGAARAGAGMALHPNRLREMLGRSQAMAELIVRDEVIAAPRTSLNVPIGTNREFDVVRVPLAELKRIKSALGGTVNDVVLAAASGGLRRVMLSRGEEPVHGMRAMVPVNVRTAGEHMALGNRISSLFVNLPVDDEAPNSRYTHVVDHAEALKSGTAAVGSSTLIELTGHAPPIVHTLLAQSLFASRLFNVTITNVPGPQTTLYALGSRLVEVAGLVPLAADHCVGIAVLSYDGHVTFGLIADRATVPDLDVLRDGIEASLDELRVLSGVAQMHAAPA
ncbi:MAG: diacylglycerol O-acyltransferase / wax synthase [Thermoleophilaceae bacterium]|jgi:WS/DGAT/MGAT family acyltransferase|nr:diacylglycerol O-acyltransferase / wax synthase [Thermoleophilaceae bacterium]